MEKLLFKCCLLLLLVSNNVFADGHTNLQFRLEKITKLQANFTQTVYSSDGTIIQSGLGELWLNRPASFRWHMIEPDESILISNGKNLWFYNPFVEQVTITNLNNTTEDTPFLLISRNNPADWENYSILQKGDNFKLTPNSNKSNLKPFTIDITKNGRIDSFVAMEIDGQRSVYVFKNQKTTAIDVTKFTFTPPIGVAVDDQR